MNTEPSTRRGLGLTLRTAIWSWLATLVTLVLFSLVIIDQQKRVLEENLASKAHAVLASLQHVASGAVVNEDFSTVVDHCKEMLLRDSTLDFLVITKNDGFTLVHDRTGWRSEELKEEEWHPATRVARGRIAWIPLFGRSAFHYSQPFDYSGIEWGWIHVGLTLDNHHRSVAAIHRQTGLLAVVCILLSLAASSFHARHLVRPILGLRNVVQRVAGGDLAARAEAGLPDELGTLAHSVNVMAEALLRRDRILESVRFAAQQFLGASEWRRALPSVLEKIGLAAEAGRAYVFEGRPGGTALNSGPLWYVWHREGAAGPDAPEAGAAGELPTGFGATPGADLLAGRILTRRVSELGPEERAQWEARGVRSCIVIPIHVAGEWWGGLGLDDGEGERVWTDAERDSLRAAADMLGATIERQRVQDALVEAKDTLELRVLERTGELREQVAAKEKALSERRRAEATLMESEERFRSLFENATVGIYRTSGEGRLLMANPALLKMLRFPSPEAAFQGDAATMGCQEPAERERYRTLIERDGQVLGLESKWRCHDGSEIHVRESAKAVREPDGGLRWYEGTVEDITERKQAEEELARLNQEVRETARQAGMAEVATGVLHNVGNVLNSVNVSANVVLDRLRQSKVASLPKLVELLEAQADNLGEFFARDPRGQRVPGYLSALSANLGEEQTFCLHELETLRKHIDHIKDIVAMQQNYARVSGVVETVAPAQLVEDALQLNAGALARHGVKVYREYTEVPLIAVEKHKVLQILVNVIRNAKYALDDARTEDKQMHVRIESASPERVRIMVIDNGVGISSENLTRIFQHGFTTRKEGHGFGLHSGALAARELGGTLTAHSDGPGRGATFTIELPLRRQATPRDRAARGSA